MTKDQNKKMTMIAVGSALVIAVLGVGVAVYAFTLDTSDTADVPSEETATHIHSEHTHDDSQRAPAASVETAALTIVYTDDGFNGTDFTVKAGELVCIENNSSKEMYFAAGEHEHHDIDSPVNLGIIEAGEASSFVAPSAGTYLFHNHDNDEHKGELIVQ